jgi:hypothetical protein
LPNFQAVYTTGLVGIRHCSGHKVIRISEGVVEDVMSLTHAECMINLESSHITKRYYDASNPSDLVDLLHGPCSTRAIQSWAHVFNMRLQCFYAEFLVVISS